MFKDSIYLFYQGLIDSTNLKQAYTRYCSGTNMLSTKLKLVVWSSFLCSLACIGYLLLIDMSAWCLRWLLPKWIYLPFKIFIYMDNVLKQIVFIQKIATNAAEIELEVLNNKDYLIYELENRDSRSLKFYDQVKLGMNSLLFSLILLLQTSLLDIVLMLLPNILIIKIIITSISYLLYSVYISVGLYSLKIPYQDHLPYYFHLNIGYLAGSSLFISVILFQFTAFPYLDTCFALIAPFMQLQVMFQDPPQINNVEGSNTTQLNRQSYKNHLISYHKDVNYKQKSQNLGGWFKIPKMMRPYILQLLKSMIKPLQNIITRYI